VHEAVKRFGVGAEIAARINEECFGKLKAPVHRIGAKYSPVPFSSVLENEYIWTAASIEDGIRKVMG
jgi:Pyruvate/2-oxoglutarate dehydrogenase complex, dehydrogenase (E1) component, eukaryotic type, beta subunit